MVRYEAVDHAPSNCWLGLGTSIAQCVSRGGCDLSRDEDELSEALLRPFVPKALSDFFAKNNSCSLQLRDSWDACLCQLLKARVMHLLSLLLAEFLEGSPWDSIVSFAWVGNSAITKLMVFLFPKVCDFRLFQFLGTLAHLLRFWGEFFYCLQLLTWHAKKKMSLSYFWRKENKNCYGGWRHDLVAKSTGCSCRAAKFNFQHPEGAS